MVEDCARNRTRVGHAELQELCRLVISKKLEETLVIAQIQEGEAWGYFRGGRENSRRLSGGPMLRSDDWRSRTGQN